MNRDRILDEYLEGIWKIREKGGGTLEDIRKIIGDDFREDRIELLAEKGLIVPGNSGGPIEFTEEGKSYTEKVIRAHRIGERLIHDVLAIDFEAGACEFEHIMDIGLVDSICTLLGHPTECPHGNPIPPGECCRNSRTVTCSKVIPLTDLDVGDSARIAYVSTGSDRQLHILDSLQVNPSAVITMHQKYPSYVIKCEGSFIALDREVASAIKIWGDSRIAPDYPDHRKHRHRRRGRPGRQPHSG